MFMLVAAQTSQTAGWNHIFRLTECGIFSLLVVPIIHFEPEFVHAWSEGLPTMFGRPYNTGQN